MCSTASTKGEHRQEPHAVEHGHGGGGGGRFTPQRRHEKREDKQIDEKEIQRVRDRIQTSPRDSSGQPLDLVRRGRAQARRALSMDRKDQPMCSFREEANDARELQGLPQLFH